MVATLAFNELILLFNVLFVSFKIQRNSGSHILSTASVKQPKLHSIDCVKNASTRSLLCENFITAPSTKRVLGNILVDKYTGIDNN